MSRPKILIVDDKERNLVALERVLEPLNAEFVSATNGNEALLHTLSHKFSLAILDVEMPVMDGFELARYLNMEEETASLPIIFLSAAYSDFGHVTRGYEAGCVDYMVKPYDPDILIQKVKILLELDQHRSKLENLVDQRTAMLKQANEDISYQKTFLEEIIESLSNPLIVVNVKDCSVELENSAAKNWGFNACSSWVMRDQYCNMDEIDSDIGKTRNLPCVVGRVVQGGKSVKVEFPFEYEGRTHYYEVDGYPVFDAQGKVEKVIQSIFDVTEHKIVKEDQRTAAQVMENVMEAIFVTNSQREINMVNPAFSTLTGYSADEVQGMKLEDLCSNAYGININDEAMKDVRDSGKWKGEVWMKRKHGDPFPMWLSLTQITGAGGTVVRYVGAGQDISQIKKAEDDIRYRAYHDPLTGLPNRALFRDRLEQAMLRADRSGKKLSILFMDLDHFKDLNDSHGHEIGDQMLKIVSKKFSQCLRAEDTVARLGGDEFTIIMEGVINPKEDVSFVARKLIEVFDQSLEIGGVESYAGVSIGIATYPDDGGDIDTLIKNADTAMYSAKDSGRNNFQFFNSDMEKKIVDLVSLETDLRKGLDRCEFSLHYQPIFDIHKNQMVGTEALLRWNRSGEGMVGPDKFIPVAEDKGLIVSIGEWVLAKACADVQNLNSQKISPFYVSVNLSARQFKEKNIVRQVEDILRATNLEPQYLALEITETTIMDDMKSSVETMNIFKSMGIRLSLDDFGSGYSSFNYLKNFPVDYLKLDKNFIHDITHDKNSAKIASVMIALATDLGMRVIAEGVEEEEQLAFLKDQGCQCVQGFLFSRPLPRDQFESFVFSRNNKKVG